MYWDSIKKQLLNKKIIVAAAVATAALLGYGTYRTVGYYSIDTKPLSKPPQEIRGKFITLRQLREEFFIPYHTMWSNMVRKNLEFPEYITLGYTIKYLQGEMRKANEWKILMYCIFDNQDKKLIGAVEIRDKNDYDPGQLGCWINEAYWGGGRIQEALKLITNVYFRLKPKEKSYIAHVRLWNTRSYKALKKFGLEDVGYYYEDGKATRYLLEMKNKITN